MSSNKSRGIVAAVSTLLLGAVASVAVLAQTPPAGAPPGGGAAGGPPGGMQMPSPAEQAISYRKALYDVISGNFSPIGAALKDSSAFNGADLLKRAERTAQLAAMLDDAFPEISKTGNTKAKPEIWTDRASFDKIAKDLVDHSAALAAVLKQDKTASAGFKTAAAAVAQDCKSCHEKFKAR